MRKIIFALALTVSTSVFAAQRVISNIYNFGSSVQVHIWNSTGNFVRCSGPIQLTTESGVTYDERYNGSVFPRSSLFQTYYARDVFDRIISVRHRIFCM